MKESMQDKIDLVCPECKHKSIYSRKDGSKRCGRCGYDSKEEAREK